MRIHRSILQLGSILALTMLAASVPPVIDLDIGVPPGAPTTWGQRYPAITPPRGPLFPKTSRPRPKPGHTVAVMATKKLKVDVQSSLGIIRILTWDIASELSWPNQTPSRPGPVTGRSSDRVPLPNTDDALYWASLAPLLRLMFHPQQVSRKETVAHLVELGLPVQTALDNAESEPALRSTCELIRSRIKEHGSYRPLVGASVRETMLKRFLAEQLVQAFPFDPSGGFGQRFMLFADELEPYLIEYAGHRSAFLARNAVAALGRYRTRTATRALLRIASSTTDSVILMRALAALGNNHFLEAAEPLVRRMRTTTDPIAKVALVAALGRSGVRAAVPALLGYTNSKHDPDLRLAALTALVRIRPTAELRKQAKRTATRLWKIARQSPEVFAAPPLGGPAPDLPDPPAVRGEIIEQLALMLLVRLDPSSDQLRRRLLSLMTRRADKKKSRPRIRAALGFSQSPLRELWPITRMLFVETLPLIGKKGIAALVQIAESNEADPVVRGHALAQLPPSKSGEIGYRVYLATTNDTGMQIHAFEAMVRENHPKTRATARDLLERCGRAGRGGGTPERRYLWLRALQYLSRRKALDLESLKPLLHHVEAVVTPNKTAIEQVRGLVKRLVRAAKEGRPKKNWRQRIDAILQLVIDHRLTPRIRAGSRTATRKNILRRLAALKKHGKRRGYVDMVEREILFQLTGQRQPTNLAQRAEFKSIVLLEQEIMFAVGRLQTDAACTILSKFLREHPASPLRAQACLAIGMCGKMSAASKLVSSLIHQDGFVRFCAFESLRHLTRQDFFTDWMHGKRSLQVRAAENYLRWLGRHGRRGK